MAASLSTSDLIQTSFSCCAARAGCEGCLGGSSHDASFGVILWLARKKGEIRWEALVEKCCLVQGIQHMMCHANYRQSFGRDLELNYPFLSAIVRGVYLDIFRSTERRCSSATCAEFMHQMTHFWRHPLDNRHRQTRQTDKPKE